ncbi:XkdX family protein [Lutispora thermophila]|uniref:Uncharacterized protein n=1 Tax=Lutispora thermophila DSM 19022 TaxID=1122184 RepID=A0A1M6CR19_9FIRM|nr:XkdX family protein [Lutispora thermophila]SHI63457.1 hypothetical protein SAMN02745176_00904 [Lutispora thermophila DSM 19022]
MSILIESLKRLYNANKVTIEKLQQMIDDERISKDEYRYIIT